MDPKKAGVGVVIPLLFFAAVVPIRKQGEIEPRQYRQAEVLTKPIVIATQTDTTEGSSHIYRNRYNNQFV